jgi:hypothetical protein
MSVAAIGSNGTKMFNNYGTEPGKPGRVKECRLAHNLLKCTMGTISGGFPG